MPGFDWDYANIDHIARHDLTPDQVEQVIQNDPIDAARYFRNQEERLHQVGETDEGLVLVVITTVRRELIRVVTAHRADKTMRRFYVREREAQRAEDDRSTQFQD